MIPRSLRPEHGFDTRPVYHRCGTTNSLAVDPTAEVIPPCGGRVAEFVSGTTTWIYGPEAGETKLTLTVRSGDDSRHTITPVLTRAEIKGRYEYHWSNKERCNAITAGSEWQTVELPLSIRPDVDRVKIEFDISPAGKIYVGRLSWRLVTQGSR